MNEIGIGLLGFGTVGAGVVEGLRNNGEMLAARLGVKPVLVSVADLDFDIDRGVPLDRAIMTDDAESVVDDPRVQVIVELIGGTGAAKDLMKRALEQGKPVVTANKHLLAEHGAEIFELAAKNSADIYFGASVGGGIPIIRALRDGLIANHIDSIYAILNGTCNYILTRMETEGLPFDDVLKEAQEAGYAEADPGLDIDGLDTAHKAVILAYLAYGFPVPMSAVHVEGIRGIAETDIEYARDLGYRIKLLAVIRRSEDGVEVGVHPALVPSEHVLASVSGVYNAAMVSGDMVGQTLYYGRGAGREPTASTVLGDIADAARNLGADLPRRAGAPSSSRGTEIREAGERETRYYLRLSLLDKPGVFASIAGVLGENGISIASVLQKEVCKGEYVPVIVVTHRAREKAFVSALAEIDSMDVVGGPTARLRIEDQA